MTDTDDTLSPQPEPRVEPGEENPGGVDALPDDDDGPLARDLSPEDNPAVDDVLPDSVAEADDKQQEPGDDQPDSGTESGTEDPEPPA